MAPSRAARTWHSRWVCGDVLHSGIQADKKSGAYQLNGIVTWGWMIGAHVNGSFDRVAPREFGKLGVGFQGTIRIQR